MRILILEDCAERRTEMLDQVADRLPMFAVSFYETSDSFIDAVKKTGLDDVALVSLDNDLEPITVDGRLVDAGTGIAAAQFLSGCAPKVPVVVHTTNTTAAPQMTEALEAAGWQVQQFIPYDGEKWIGELWLPTVRKMITSNITDVLHVNPASQ